MLFYKVIKYSNIVVPCVNTDYTSENIQFEGSILYFCILREYLTEVKQDAYKAGLMFLKYSYEGNNVCSSSVCVCFGDISKLGKEESHSGVHLRLN